MRTFSLVFFVISSSVLMDLQTVSGLNNRPIIGLAVQHVRPFSKLWKYGDGFIHSPYVRFLESGGARVVPVMLYETEGYYKSLFMKINGLLLPGGGSNLTNSGYSIIGRYFIRFAMEAYDAGDYFPIWGTCRGLQLLTRVVSGEEMLENVDARNYPVPLDFEPGFRHSKLFRNAPERIIRLLQNENTAIANHKNGILYKDFIQNHALMNFFQIVSTNVDRRNQKFISTIEAHRYPFYGVQYHPEKAAFLWDAKFDFPHTRDAIDVGHYFASFFVDEARRSNHRFSSQKEEQEAVIQNYPGYHDTEHYPFEIIYAFNCTKRVIQIDGNLG